MLLGFLQRKPRADNPAPVVLVEAAIRMDRVCVNDMIAVQVLQAAYAACECLPTARKVGNRLLLCGLISARTRPS